MTEESGNGRLFVLAANLAMEGLYAEATKVLQKALAAGECTEAEALDLQARIYAQEGLDFQAESRWRKAQQSAGSDPPPDRTPGRPKPSLLSTGSLFHESIALAVLAVLALLFWQILSVNPKLSDRLTSNETSLAMLREGLAEFKHSTQVGDQDLSRNIMSLNNNISTLDQRLTERLSAMWTATGLVQDHAAAITRLNEKIDELQKIFDRKTASAEVHRTQLRDLDGEPSPTPPPSIVTGKASTEGPTEPRPEAPDTSSKSVAYAPGSADSSQVGQTLYFIVGASLKSEPEAQSRLNSAIPALGTLQPFFGVHKSDNFEGMMPGWWVIAAAHKARPSKKDLDSARRAFPGASIRKAVVRTPDPIPVHE